MKTDFDVSELTALIERVLDAPADSDWLRLAQILRESPAPRRFYARYMQLRATMLLSGIGPVASATLSVGFDHSDDVHADMNESVIMSALRMDLLGDDQPDLSEIFPPTPNLETAIPPYRRSRWRLWTAAASVALIVGFTLTVLYSSRDTSSHIAVVVPVPRPPRPLATITRNIGAQWADAVGASTIAPDLVGSTQFSLVGGYVEFVMNSGADVILQAPASFRLLSANQIDLENGQLAATVPVRAHGFSVQTRQGTLIDQGTEFGVQVPEMGPCRVDVFKGKVQVAANGLPGRDAEVPVLMTGQAAALSDTGVTLDARGAVPQHYARDLSLDVEQLSLVDLTSGGDGTTLKQGVAFDANTGRFGSLQPAAETEGDHLYHLVAGLPIIDGCLIPDGSNGLQEIDSARHTFAFPPTANRSYNHIWTGGLIPWPATVEIASTTAGGIDYAKSPHNLIFIHSNQAITINLSAVRRLHPGNRVSQFTCAIANTYSATPSTFDVFLIVDGVPRFQRRAITRSDGVISVEVPLTESDAFLTLATTDGNKDIWGDWGVWGDPIFRLTHR